MAQRRWLVGIGAAVLVGMLLCAAFSLGVYIGRYGPTAQGLRYGAPAAGDGAQPGQPGAQGQPGALDQPDLIGMLRRSTDGTLELATRQGPRQVEVNGQTEIGDGFGGTLTLEDLRPGDVLAVFGSLIPGDGRRFQAERILRVTAPAPSVQP